MSILICFPGNSNPVHRLCFLRFLLGFLRSRYHFGASPFIGLCSSWSTWVYYICSGFARLDLSWGACTIYVKNIMGFAVIAHQSIQYCHWSQPLPSQALALAAASVSKSDDSVLSCMLAVRSGVGTWMSRQLLKSCYSPGLPGIS